MIEVVLYATDGELSRAYADDPEGAITTARTLWDDHMREGVTWYGSSKFLRLVFNVDGKMVRMVEGRRP